MRRVAVVVLVALLAGCSGERGTPAPVAPGGAAAPEGTRSTPLFHRRLPGGPVRLAAGQRADVAVVLDPARCDAHALADDERGFGPQLQFSLDGAAAVPVRLWVPRQDRAAATDALVSACAGGVAQQGGAAQGGRVGEHQ